MEIGTLLRDNPCVYLVPYTGEHSVREYAIDTHVRQVATTQQPVVEYLQYMEFYDPKDPYRIRIFECHDGYMVILVVEDTQRIATVYLQHGKAIPRPADYIDPDERLRRLKICTRHGNQSVYNVWPTQEFAHAS